MLDHLKHHHINSLDDAIPLVGDEWIVLHFPPAKASKPAMYGRMWKLRSMGTDSMVRELNGEYVLVAKNWR